MSDEKEEIKLTPKQKQFADYYIGEARQNATKAARLAGYSEKTAYSIGWENLRKPEISDYIQARLKELTLSAEIVLTRLTEIANGDVDDFLDENGLFDLQTARKNGKTPLIKKLKQKRTIKAKKTEVNQSMQSFLADDEIDEIETDVEIIYEETEFELYSAHEALRDLGKHHKLFTDKTEVETTVNLPEQLAGALEKALEKAYGDKFAD